MTRPGIGTKIKIHTLQELKQGGRRTGGKKREGRKEGGGGQQFADYIAGCMQCSWSIPTLPLFAVFWDAILSEFVQARKLRMVNYFNIGHHGKADPFQPRVDERERESCLLPCYAQVCVEAEALFLHRWVRR